jgi:hypothetical protein
LFAKKVKRKMKGPFPGARREEGRVEREEAQAERRREGAGWNSTLEAALARGARAVKNVVE